MTLPPNKPSKTAGEDLTPSADAIEQDVLKKKETVTSKQLLTAGLLTQKS